MKKIALLISVSLFFMLGGAFAQDAYREEAQKHMDRGLAAMAAATGPFDYLDASEEFGKAIAEDQLWADAYFNRAVALEKLGDFGGAIKDYESYLRYRPDAGDRTEVKTRINKLQYLYEKARKDLPTILNSVLGNWKVQDGPKAFTNYYIRTSGEKIFIEVTSLPGEI